MDKKFIVIVIVVVVVAVGGTAAFFLLSPKAPEGPKYSSYDPGDYFVANIKDSKGLIKADIELKIKGKDEKQQEFLKENNAVIRNEVLYILRQKTEEELKALDVQENLGKEIVGKLNEKLGIDYILTIYFNEYVTQ